MAMKEMSEHVGSDRKAVVYLDTKSECYSVDFYENGSMIGTEEYPNKSVNWAEDCAENWILGIKKKLNDD